MIRRLIWVAGLPVYVPVSLALWVYYFVSDMQANTDALTAIPLLTQENTH